MRSFGIGCFHFGITENMPKEFSPAEYTSEIEKCLMAIDNISDVKVDYQTIREKFTWEEIPDFNAGEEWYPYLSLYEIVFSIYLPQRVQSDLLGDSLDELRIGTENFRITLTSGYYAPITFIEPLNVKVEPHPSDAVVLIRRYLDRELKKQKDSKVKFEYIGPSPFHANFFVAYDENLAEEEKFEVIVKERSGYDIVEYHYRYSENEEEALVDFYDIIREEISLYYYIIRNNVSHSHKWEELTEEFSNIIHTSKRKKLRDILSHGQHLRKLYDNICSFKAELILDKSIVQKNYNECYRIKGCFDKYIKREIDGALTFPISELIEILKFRENRHSKFWEKLTLLVSAILGGVIGSLLTMIFS